MRKILLLLSILCISISTSSLASDLAKENRWKQQIVDSLLVGEAVELGLAGKTEKFLGLYSRVSARKHSGAAIILHGKGTHPNWPDIIYPLRTELPEHGWTTLSIQMPVLANDASSADYAPLFDEVAPRIDAAIAYLKARDINNIVLIGHSMGATMASYYLSTKPKTAIRAFVGIGMGSSSSETKMDNPASLAKITIPVLDLYGDHDLDSVIQSASKRSAAANIAKNKYYRQLKIMGADHFFHDLNSVLIKRVRSWLQRYASGSEISL